MAQNSSNTADVGEHITTHRVDPSFRSGTQFSFRNNIYSETEKTEVASQSQFGRIESPYPSFIQATAEAHDRTSIDREEDEIQYPGPVKLFFITLALSLAVFLVALVSMAIRYSTRYTNPMKDQTIIATV
jgi:hypothetical protein